MVSISFALASIAGFESYIQCGKSGRGHNTFQDFYSPLKSGIEGGKVLCGNIYTYICIHISMHISMSVTRCFFFKLL